MSVVGAVSIQGANSSLITFTVTGTHTLAYAQAFANTVDTAGRAGSLTAIDLRPLGGTSHAPASAPVAGVTEYEIARGGFQDITIPTNGAYTVITAGGYNTIEGSAGGGNDTVLAGSAVGLVTYVDHGGNNTIDFIAGNNTYMGDSSGTTAQDVVVTGAGFDTVNTGANATTVYAGTGDSTIFLSDTIAAAAGTFNDFAILDDGVSTVVEGGKADLTAVTSTGNSIFGGLDATALNGVSFGVGQDLANTGNNTVVAGAAQMFVWDSSNGNQVFGGSGALTFVGGANIAATVIGGTGANSIFGGAGDTLTYGGSGAVTYVAGVGNESLNGATGSGNNTFFANNTTDTVSSPVSETMVGGSGNDIFATGSGAETLLGGGGTNDFFISAVNNGLAAHIVLADFATSGASNLAVFASTFTNLQQSIDGATIQTASYGGQTITGEQMTLSDGTQILFGGIMSIADLQNHIG